jgi:hypothetical protein
VLKKILLVVVMVVGGLLIYAAFKPDSFKVQRTAMIAATPGKLFPLIDDMKAFNSWNPYVRDDPTVHLKYEGAATGPGAAYAWKSEKSGVGRMEVIESTSPSTVVMRLEFEEPMKATNQVMFTLEPQADYGTKVTWVMTGSMPYLHRVMAIFFDMDKMIGNDFDAGLANLKSKEEHL